MTLRLEIAMEMKVEGLEEYKILILEVVENPSEESKDLFVWK